MNCRASASLPEDHTRLGMATDAVALQSVAKAQHRQPVS
jgi:hypothetical protein